MGGKSGIFLVYCLSVHLIQIQSYRAFSNMAVDHWCLSLNTASYTARSRSWHVEDYPHYFDVNFVVVI